MSTTVIAKMNTCGKTNKVTAELQEDGTIKIDIESDCPNIQAYNENLVFITMDDAIDFNGSKINLPEIRGAMSAPCLTPNAVFDASWVELGMLSKNLIKSVERNTLEFE